MERPLAGAMSPEPPRPVLFLKVLDALEIECAGREAASRTRLPIGKEAELLALLAYRPAGVTRAEAAGLLWPDAADSVARHRLRTLVLELRHRQDGLIEASRDRLSLASGVAAEIDGDGTFAPGLAGDWLDEAREDLALRRAAALTFEARALAAYDPAGALRAATRAVRLAPEALAPQAVLASLAAPREAAPDTPALLSLRDRARLAVAHAPLNIASGRLLSPAREIETLLAQSDAARASVEPALQAALLVAAAGYAHERGDPVAAARFALQARAGAPAPADEIAAWIWTGRAALALGEFAEAVAAARRAVRRSEGIGDTDGALLGDLVASAAQLLLGRYAEGEGSLARARGHVSGEGARPRLRRARCENLAGWLALSQGSHARAERAFAAALALDPSPDRRLNLNVLQGLARAALARGDRAATRARLEEALTSVAGTDLDRAAVERQLAELEEAEGRWEEALALYRVGLARSAGDRFGLYTSLAGIGRASLHLGRKAEAVRHLREAYAVHLALFGEIRLAVPALPLADALLGLGRRREAASFAARGLESLAAEPAEVRAGSSYPAEIPVLAEKLAHLAQS